MQMSGLIREQPASMAARQGPELNSRIYEQPSGSAGEQCWTEIFRLPGELRRGPGVRRCRRTPRHRRGEPARHPSRSRRRCAPDRSSINPAPDPVFADIENFRPRDRLRARDRSRTFGTAVNNASALIFRQAERAGCGSGWRQPHEHGHIVALGRTSEVIERQRLQVECAPSMTTTCCETRG
jgi:hypothetical protein